MLTASLDPIVVLEEVARGARSSKPMPQSSGCSSATSWSCEPRAWAPSGSWAHVRARPRESPAPSPSPVRPSPSRCRAAAAPGAGRSPARARPPRAWRSARRARGGLYGVLGVYSNARRLARRRDALGLAATASAFRRERRALPARRRGRSGSGAILANIADGIVAVDRDDRSSSGMRWPSTSQASRPQRRSDAVPEVLQRSSTYATEGRWAPRGDQAAPTRSGSRSARRSCSTLQARSRAGSLPSGTSRASASSSR